MDHAYLNHSLAMLGAPFVIFAQTSVASKPSECTFNNPTTGKYDEALLVLRTFDNLQKPIAEVFDPLQKPTGIPSISPNEFGTRKSTIGPQKDKFRTITVLDARSMNDTHKQKFNGVDKDMLFSPIDLFASIIASPSSRFRGFCALAVDDGRTGTGLTTSFHTQFCAQNIMGLLPYAHTAPQPEVMIGGFLLWEVVRQQAPLAASSYNVDYGAQNGSQTDLSRSSRPLVRYRMRQQ
jgi:hypothetical protein